MKKTIFLIITLVFLSSCSSKPKTEETTASKNNEAATQPEEAPAPQPVVLKEAELQNSQPVVLQNEKLVSEYDADGNIVTFREIETTTTTTKIENNSSTSLDGNFDYHTSILDSEYGRFSPEDYEAGHAVQTYYEATDSDDAIAASEVETYNIDDGLATFSSAASQRRFITDRGEFENGLYEVSKRCNVRSAPSKESEILGVISVGKVVWAEENNEKWAKVFRKDGPAYLHKGCL